MVDDRPPDVLHEEEKLDKLPAELGLSLGKVTVERITTAVSALDGTPPSATVGDLRRLTAEQRAELLMPPPNAARASKQTQVARMSQSKLRKIFAVVDKALPGDAGIYVTDYRAADNPYKARFGDSSWEAEMAKTTHMAAHVPVTDMIHHMMKESAEMMKGTKHEKDWLLEHDALSQMTAKETLDWMKTQTIGGRTYFDIWLLPQGLESEVPSGNNPEGMYWDSSCNKDVDDCVDYQVRLTQHLAKNDPRKFSCNTPKLQDEAYSRVMDPAHGPDGGTLKS